MQAMLAHPPLAQHRRRLLAKTTDERGCTALHAAIDAGKSAIAGILLHNVRLAFLFLSVLF